MTKERFQAFSDGVFAIAITLLVLEIHVPLSEAAHGVDYHAGWNLVGPLLAQAPVYVAYILSFTVIGIMWMHHNALFGRIDTVDRATIQINLALLALTAFIPFATALIGEYPDAKPATLVYGLVLTGCSIVYRLLLERQIARGVLPVSAETIRATRIRFSLGFAVYAAATLTSLLSAQLAFGLYCLNAAWHLLPGGVESDTPS